VNPRTPRLTSREIIRILERRGFVLSRSSGSHHIYRDPEGHRVTVPVHSGKILHPKVLQSILNGEGIAPQNLGS
jgi:predicted RNA binding protein YcfA (HicA-like mRNA interferase family)